jgi:hypothetical protein
VRLALLARTYHGPTGRRADGPTGRAPRHLPFRRAALSFMRWQAHRGVLAPLGASPPGSRWWRQVNERLLRDSCEAVALADRYPLDRDVGRYLADEQRFGRGARHAVIVPRLQRVYEWSAQLADR